MRLSAAIVLIGMLVVALLIIMRSSGPRVTTIELRREKEDSDDA